MASAAATSHPATELARLLEPHVPVRLHPWRLVATTVGALCGRKEVAPSDLLGFYSDAPLRLDNADQGRRAVALTERLVGAVGERLTAGAPLLDDVPAPAPGRAFALALAHALYGFADGLDLADIDPDDLPEPAAERFERLGRRAAATEALADALPDRVDNAVGEELQALADQTDADLLAFWSALRAR